MFDIRQAEQKQAVKPESEKQKSFLSLSELPKKDKGLGQIDRSTEHSPKPQEPQKKKVDFSELKKVLSDSFISHQESRKQEAPPALHDRTGMLTPKNPNTPVASPMPKPEEEKKGKSAGVLKTGERIKF
jgi:hypothetical protein